MAAVIATLNHRDKQMSKVARQNSNSQKKLNAVSPTGETDDGGDDSIMSQQLITAPMITSGNELMTKAHDGLLELVLYIAFVSLYLTVLSWQRDWGACRSVELSLQSHLVSNLRPPTAKHLCFGPGAGLTLPCFSYCLDQALVSRSPASRTVTVS